MNRKQALQTLAENRNRLKRFSVKDLYLFGSVAHDYFGVDEETVWLTAKERIPQLKPSIEKILAEIRNAKG